MKAGWETRPLGEVVKLNYGKAIAKEVRGPAGLVPVYGANGIMDYCQDALAEGPSIIVGRKGSAGAVNVADGPFWASDVSYFTQHDPRRIDFSFLLYFLRHLNLPSLAKGVKPGINRDEVYALTILLPPVEEQQRIVAVLDEAFEGLTRARAHVEANLQNARELFDKRLTRAFIEVEGDANTSTATVAEVAHPRKGSIRTGPFGSQLLHSEFTESGIAVLGIDNAVKNEFHWSRYRFISLEKYADLRRYTVFPGDVIITIMGTCGRCAVVPDDIPTAINTKHLCCITLDRTKCLPDYLHCYFLHSPTALEYLAQNATGSVMDGLNMGLIKNLPVRVPSLEHQARVVEVFQSAKADAAALQLHYDTKLKSLDALRQSLLQRAFAGELT